MSVSENVKRVKQEIGGIAGNRVRLVAVTKTATLEQAKEAVTAGVDAIAENRAQVAEEKLPYIAGVEKHMIGHLQRNKVKRVVEIFDVIQSVDSLRLAKEIDKRAKDASKVMRVMLQVNVGGEEQKFGLSESEVEEVYKQVLGLMNVKVIGIMVMAPFVENQETRQIFRKANEIRKKLKLPELSAGMSNDYHVAIEEGSTMVRLGRTLFSIQD